MDKQKLISIGQLFRKSFAFYHDKFYTIAKLACIPFANFVIISLLHQLGGTKASDVSVAIWLTFILFSIVALAVNFWVQITFFYLINATDNKIGSLLKLSFGKIASYAWVGFLVGVICAAGFLLFIIPGVIFVIWFGLSLYVFVFEEKKGMLALERSRELVKGYWWPVLGRMMLFGVIAAAIGAIPVFGTIANIFFTAPLGIFYGYFLYQDLKMIKG